MFVLAVTGGIGSGKTEAMRFFAERGAVVLGLDELAREQLSEPQVLDRLVAEFGPRILDQRGAVAISALADAAFADPREAARLNAVVHPAVTQALQAALARLRDRSEPPEAVVIEVPLLAEAPHIRGLVDRVLAIEAPAEVRVERAVRRGMPEADARRRLAAQATDEERAALADDVITNATSAEDFRRELEQYWEREVVGR